MTTVIALQNGMDLGGTQRSITSLQGIKDIELIVVGQSDLDTNDTTTKISTDNCTASEAIEAALSQASSSTIVLVNGSCDLSNAEVLADLMTERDGIVTAPVSYNGASLEARAMAAEELIAAIAKNSQWPTLVFSAPKEFMSAIDTSNLESVQSFIGRALFTAIIQNEGQISTFNSWLTLTEGADANAALAMSTRERSRALELAIQTHNIEELFPNHAWEEHGEESAAASYHSLAALFIRLENTDLAMQCLSCGDQLEDSPRSLALKALIAQQRGETLGAVANMVSSLQEYEKRKRDDSSKHYLSFHPQDIEVINKRLNEGLAALNKRDNETALDHFKAAVFNFDGFYSDLGIDS